MKNLIILVALVMSIPAISAQNKDYKYKDISTKQARPLNGISHEKSFEKKSSTSKNVDQDRIDIQEQEELLKDRKIDDSKVQ